MIEFTVDTPTINATPADSKDGVEVPVNIKFEPSGISESKALLTITSNEGGSYQYYLVGQSLNPQPKGPFKSSGKGIAIDFKNPFYEATEFMVRIDNPSFTTSVKNPLKLEVDRRLTLGRQDHHDPSGLQGSPRPNCQWACDSLHRRRTPVDLLCPGRLTPPTSLINFEVPSLDHFTNLAIDRPVYLWAWPANII